MARDVMQGKGSGKSMAQGLRQTAEDIDESADAVELEINEELRQLLERLGHLIHPPEHDLEINGSGTSKGKRKGTMFLAVAAGKAQAKASSSSGQGKDKGNDTSNDKGKDKGKGQRRWLGDGEDSESSEEDWQARHSEAQRRRLAEMHSEDSEAQ